MAMTKAFLRGVCVAALCLSAGAAFAQGAGGASGVGSTPSSGGLPIGGTSPSTGMPDDVGGGASPPPAGSAVGNGPSLPTNSALRPMDTPPGNLHDPQLAAPPDDAATPTQILPAPSATPSTPPTFPLPGAERGIGSDPTAGFRDPASLP